MQVDTVKAAVTYVTAGLVTVGSLVLGVFVWMQPATEGRDLAIIFGLLGTAFGAGSAFLFGQESATRASRATERAVAMTPAPALEPLEDAGDVDPLGANVGV